MPTYTFVAADGSLIERVCRITKIPKQVRIGGKVYKLAAYSPGNTVFFNDAQVSTTTHGYPRVDPTLPKGDVGAGVSPSGHAIIASQHHERELMREHGLRRD
jgi:hypothetical protein